MASRQRPWYVQRPAQSRQGRTEVGVDGCGLGMRLEKLLILTDRACQIAGALLPLRVLHEFLGCLTV